MFEETFQHYRLEPFGGGDEAVAMPVATINAIFNQPEIAVAFSPVSGKSLAELAEKYQVHGVVIAALAAGEPITIVLIGGAYLVYRLAKPYASGFLEAYDEEAQKKGKPFTRR